MAFQAGTQIRPELANADYSGFANAANIQAQSMMNLGQQIAGGIEKYQRNKQIKGQLTGQIEGAINTNPGLLASLEQLEEVSSAVKKMQDGKAGNNDLFMVQGAISSIQGEEQRQNQVRLQALQEQMLQNQADTQTINNQALNIALDANTTPEGTVDVRGTINTFVSQGGSDSGKLKMLQTMQDLQDQNKPSKLEVVNLDGFNVLTQNGEYKLATKSDGSEVTTERQRRVDELMETMGMSRTQALGIVEGLNRVVQDPTTGDTVMLNMATGESEPLDLNPDFAQELKKLSQPQDKVKGGLFDLVGEDTTGIVPGFLETIQGVTGSLPGVAFNVEDPENTEARQMLNMSMQSLGRALAENPRFSEGEQLRIREEVNIKPSAFNDPQTLRSRMKAINTTLEDRIDDYMEEASSKATTRAQKSQAVSKIATIRNFLDDLGVPEEGEQPEKQAEGFTLSEDEQALVNQYINQ